MRAAVFAECTHQTLRVVARQRAESEAQEGESVVIYCQQCGESIDVAGLAAPERELLLCLATGHRAALGADLAFKSHWE